MKGTAEVSKNLAR